MTNSEEPTKMDAALAWAEGIPQVKNWLSKIQAKQNSAFDLYRFCQWVHLTPIELLALKADESSKTAEQLLDTFVADENSGFTNAVKFRFVSTVKSFFKYNYHDLAHASGALERIKVKPTNLPTRENLRKLWNWALNPRDKALITFVASTAIAKGSIPQIKWSHLEEGWETIELPYINLPGEILKGHGIGRYRGLRQITFLTPEAKRDLLNYREWIEQKLGRKLSADDRIFLETYKPYPAIKYGRLGTLVWRLSREARVPFSWHDARRHVNTALEQVSIAPNWAKIIRGRKPSGSESPYSRPVIEQLRAKFKEAVPLLEFTTERQIVIPQEIQERLKALEDEQRGIKRQYGIYTRKRIGKAAEEAVIAKMPPEQRAIARKMAKQAEKHEEPERDEPDCPDGEHCEAFKQIREEELLTYLRDGWKIECKLSDGQFIMRK